MRFLKHVSLPSLSALTCQVLSETSFPTGFFLAPGTFFRLANGNWRTLVLWLLGLDFVTEVPFRLHPFVVSSFSNLSSSPEATGPLAFASAPDFSAPFVVSIRPLNLQQFSCICFEHVP